MMKERLLQRVDELIEMGSALLRTRHRDDDDTTWELYTHLYGGPSRRDSPGPESVDDGRMREFRTASLSFIGSVYDDKHSYYLEFHRIGNGCDPGTIERSLGILRAIRGEIAGDWLFKVRSLVTADVFADYMEMAEYLLDSDYKDPAAVIAGSTLEEHLRELCRNNRIPVTQKKNGKDVPLTGEPLNVELAKKGVYNNNQQKAITGWLGIRNSAAHGKYGEYTAEQVKGMIAGITEFMARLSV